jgi:hypothetical protein
MAITFGATGAPSQITENMDALVATSLANYKKTLTDNISKSNAFYHELSKAGLWEGRDGGLFIAEDLMYELGTADSYDGYDELSDAPTDGITQVQFEWRQGAAAITYSEKERIQNKHRLVNLVESKIKQAEMGFIEMFKRALLLGSLAQSAAGSLTTPWTSAVNGSTFIDPLPKLIHYAPTTSVLIGNINQSTSTWWRNQQKESAATTYSAFLAEMDNMYHNCSKGPGGPPTLIMVDQTTYELWNAAYYYKYQRQATTDNNYPFENILFHKAHVIWEEDVPNVYAGTSDTTTATGGTAYFINPQFFKVVYENERNFTHTPFVKPPKGDSKLAHILFMGQTTMNNRRKHGVVGKIARTLTAS